MPSASSRQRMDDLTADDEKAEETEAQIPLEELLLNAAEDGYQLDKPYLRASGLVSLGSIPVSRFFVACQGQDHYGADPARWRQAELPATCFAELPRQLSSVRCMYTSFTLVRACRVQLIESLNPPRCGQDGVDAVTLVSSSQARPSFGAFSRTMRCHILGAASMETLSV